MIDSSLDVSAYTGVITEIYGKHPEFRNIPKGYLMSFLTDQKYKTADQLSEMAIQRQNNHSPVLRLLALAMFVFAELAAYRATPR